MNIKPIKLTKADKLILQSCKNSIDGLSDYLGKGFELVLHSLENFDQSVIKIVMGYHSGRHEGSPLTNLALDMLATINQDQNSKKYISYFNKRENGEILKSTTIAIMGERERIIGLLCINLYLTTSIADMFSDYAPRLDPCESEGKLEELVQTSDELIINILKTTKERVNRDPNIPTNLKNKMIIQELYETGLFNLKDSVISVSTAMDISKNTVYLHLRNIKERYLHHK